ncbi:hypothetical protein [Bacillus thuringiensis]|nr:hypothetical protein [Bacillus thuringiensis]
MGFEKKNLLIRSKSAEFLCSYSWKGKSKEQIIDEMEGSVAKFLKVS